MAHEGVSMGTHYSAEQSEGMLIKCLAQEHIILTQLRVEPALPYR